MKKLEIKAENLTTENYKIPGTLGAAEIAFGKISK